jgi:hypothetical protein
MYYGCLKGTYDKWLDIEQLFDNIIYIQNPESQLIKVKFFTAPIKAKMASHDKVVIYLIKFLPRKNQ